MSEPVSHELTVFVRLFDQGLYWDSHEALEPAWRETRSDFYHGLILLASAYVHRDRGNPHGVGAQLDKAEPLLRRYGPRHMGVNVERLLEQARELRLKHGPR